MSNPNPYRARLAKNAEKLEDAISTHGTLKDALLTQWRAIKAAEAVLLDELEKGANRDASIVRSMVHAVSQANTAFSRLVEVGEFDGRLSELEAAVTARTHTNGKATGRAFA